MRGVYLEEEINGFIFREYSDLGRPRVLVLGLPDVGLVGSIAAMHIIRSLDLKDSVGVESYAFLPPVVVITRGEPKHPMRIYSNGEIAALVTDVPVSPAGIPALSSAIVEYARRKGVELLVSITGLGSPARLKGGEPKAYWIASTERAERKAQSLGLERFSDGIMVGPYSIVLKEAARKRVDNIVILVESYVDFPDPEAAAEAVKAVSKLTGVNIDVGKLLKEAETLKLRLQELMKGTKETLSKMGKGYEYSSTLIYS
ncbi:MAG: PAC2 family protein [Desulfurococcales archaeon]|nr:PAC2 family protein [Desulfurococcales archaeon]